MKFCSKCGNELFDEAVGCATENKKQNKQTNKNIIKGTVLIIAGILVVVAFVILVAMQL